MKPRKRKKRLDPNTLQLIRQIVGGALFVILLVLIIVSIWYGTRVESMTISQINVSGGQTISHELVEDIANNALEGEYLSLIPKRFTLLYPKQTIIERVLEIDRINNLSVERDSFTALSITFDEFVPDALWCAKDSKDCVFMDVNGYAFAKAPELSGGAFLRLDKLGVTPVTNVQAFNVESYNQIKSLIVLLEESGWFIEQVEVDAADDAYFTLTEGGELKVALADAPEQIVDNLFTVLSAEEFTEIGPGNFEYIDLRFGNKVFVNELEPEPELEELLASSTEPELE